MTTNDIFFILLTGAGATAITDLWALIRRRIFGTPLPNLGLVGRWIAHMPRGRVPQSIAHRGQLADGEVELIGLAHEHRPVDIEFAVGSEHARDFIE